MGLFRRENRAGTGERRDPTAATQSIRYTTPGRAVAPDWDAEKAYDVAYYMDPITYACVRAIASTVAALPFRAGPDPTSPESFNPNAPLAKMLGSEPPDGPCPGLGASDLWFTAIRDYLVTGRFGWEIETNGDTIAALWPLTAAALKPIPSKSGTQWFSGFVYGRPAEEVNLPAERVFYVWHPSGNDFRQPESALRAASLAVNISIMQGTYDYSFLKNDARPATVVVTEEFEDEDSKRAFEQQFNGEFRGPTNAGKAAFLEATGSGDAGVKGAVEIIPLGVSQKDAQTQQRAEARQHEIAMALGVPWSRLDASGRTFDNASQEDEIFWRQTLLPIIGKLQNAVNVQLAPRLGSEFGWFDLSGVPVLNPQPAPVAVTPAPMNVTLNATAPEERKLHAYQEGEDGCAECGKPAVHQAHGYFLPEGMSVLPRQARPAAVEGRESAPAQVTPAPSPEIDHEERRARVWRTADGKIRNLERQWERAMKKLFARQSRSALARLEGKRGRSLVRGRDVRATAGEVFDPDHWLDETIDDATALYESVVAAGGARVSDLFGIAFDLEAPYAQEFIQARAKQLAGQVTDTTYQAIKDALAEGVGEGEAIPDLAARIKHVFTVATDSRATTIARTEVISAFNGSASLTAAEYGEDVVAGQEWIATSDSRTREAHSYGGGVGGEIIAMGDTFSNGLAYPGDPSGPADETVNCRCTVAFLTPEEMDGRSGGRAPKMIERRVALAAFRAWDGTKRETVRDAWRLAA